ADRNRSHWSTSKTPSYTKSVSWQHHPRLQPRYDYPNKNMHQRDEKEQVNLFLADWLKFCLRHGTSLINIL
ncbi:DUF1249 domain-containing protein, partial [Aeromonas hydrophila]